MARRLAILIAAVAIIGVFAPRSMGGSTSYLIIAGSSMLPTLTDGDLVLVRESPEYEIGDVVAFESGRGVVIHRIIDDGPEGFVMQGDNKERPDPWTPDHNDILGKQFVHVPEAGRWLTQLRQSPQLLGAVMGGLGSIGVWSSRKRLRRRGAHSLDGSRRRGPRTTSAATSLRGAGVVLAALAAIAAIAAALLVFLLVRPGDRVETIDIERYVNTGEFDYTAFVQPSVIYSSTTIEPPTEGEVNPPLYVNLLERIDVTFDYRLEAPGETSTTGTFSADLRVQAGVDGWVRFLELAPQRDFEDTAGISIDWRTVQDLVTRAAEQSGDVPASYRLDVVTRVEPSSEIAVEDETFVASLPMTLTETTLVIDNDALAVSESVTEAEDVIVPNDIDLFGLTIPIDAARLGTATVFAVALLGAAGYFLRIRRRTGGGEVGRILLRHGALIVPVASEPTADKRIDVASIGDLVRLARRSEQMVFHYADGHGDRFFVPDGAVTYEYRPSGSERAHR